MQNTLPCISQTRPGIGATLAANGVAASDSNIDAISALIYVAHIAAQKTRPQLDTRHLAALACLLHATASIRPIPADAIYQLQIEALICTAAHKLKFAVQPLRESADPVYEMGGH